MRLRELNNKLFQIRDFMKDCCVCTIAWNIPSQQIKDFINWYEFLGVSKIYILDNCNQDPIENAVVKFDEKQEFHFALSELKKWVKRFSNEKYMLLCDVDEYLFIEDPNVLKLINEYPLALNWFNLVGDFEKNLKNIAHPVFSYNFGNFSDTVKCIGKVEDMSEEFLDRSHYSFNKDLKVVDSNGDVKKMIHDEGTKTIQFTDPKGKLYDKAWFLHLRVRSKEDWERKANEQSQWTYYRAKNNFKDWFDMFPRTIHTNSKHLDWFYHFNKFLSL